MKKFNEKHRPIYKLINATIASSILYTISIKCFVQADGVNLLAAGIGGIAIILSRLFNVSSLYKDLIFSGIYFVINIPILLVAYKRIGKLYTLFTIFNFTLIAIFNIIIPSSLFSFLNLDPQSDLLLIAVCSGTLSGLGSGIALKEGLSTGGVDTIVTYLGIKYNKQAGSLSIYVNAAILLIGGLLFHEWVAMLYTVILIFIAGEVINMIYRRTKKRMICIITTKGNEMAEEFIKISKHGITLFKCKGAYSKEDKYEVRTIVLESEVQSILSKAQEIDNQSFITIVNVHNVNGAFTMPEIK